MHADDRDERPVTGDDTYRLVTMADETLNDAVKFIEIGGFDSEAVRIIASIARLTPRQINEW